MPADEHDDDGGAAALADLRRARRRRRVADLDRFESLYRAYLAGFLGSLGIVFLSNLAGDRAVTPAELADVRAHGAAATGLVLAVCVAVGIRSGGRGGPLALAAADVRHVLLAPVDRAVALRSPALRQVRSGAFVGAVVGGTAGLNASHRLPGGAARWVLAGALVGLATALGSFGAALLASGTRLSRRLSGALALAVVTWSAVDLAEGLATSPLTRLGGLALLPLRFAPGDLVGLGVMALAPIGLAAVGGSSLEAAEARARLVGQMRFGATLGDVRTVLVLRRQLAQEQPRAKPWLPVARPPLVLASIGGPAPAPPAVGATGGGGRGSTLAPGLRLPTSILVRRSVWALSRWPLGRLARLVVLAVVAAVLLCVVWRGTKALLLPAGLCAYLAALDAIEPMAQQVDHPDRSESAPRVAGQLRVKLLIVPVVVMVLLGLVGIGTAVALGAPVAVAVGVGVPTAAAVAVLAVAGAATSTMLGPDFGASSALMSPEVQGMKELFRFGFPPACCIVGMLPVLGGRAAFDRGLTAGTGAMQAAVPAIGVLGLLVLGWVRFREDVAGFFAQANEEAREASRIKAEQKRAAEEEDRDG